MTDSVTEPESCYTCEHGTQRGIIGVLSEQVWGGSSHPSEASYESGDYLGSQCLESGTTLPAPPEPATARHQFYLNPVVTYEENHQGSGSQAKQRKIEGP